MNKKVICPDCGFDMDLYGIFESGIFKYHCPSCCRMLDETEAAVYKPKPIVNKGEENE